jgi:hypothetical protein
LNRPGDPARQHVVLEAALGLLEDANLEPPALVDYRPPVRP